MLRPTNRPAKPGDRCMVTHRLSYGKQVHCERRSAHRREAFEVIALEPLTVEVFGYRGFTQVEGIAKLPAGGRVHVDSCYLVPLDDWKDDEVAEQKAMPHSTHHQESQ